MNFELSRLAVVSRHLGEDVSLVQGGGGNTSIKMRDSEVMYIKASGINLANIDADSGFLPIDPNHLIQGIKTCRTEADYNALLTEARLNKTDNRHRPSIESGFHALLGTCVLHTHSIWANLLTCSVEGKRIVSNLIPEALWIDYVTPGLPLTLAIADQLSQKQSSIIFLQNHGLIVIGDTPESAYDLHQSVNLKIKAYFPQLPAFPLNMSNDIADEGLLFPDQAVYQTNPALAASVAGKQTAQAYIYLSNTIPELGLTLRFIRDEEKAFLLNMDSEKHRQKVTQL